MSSIVLLGLCQEVGRKDSREGSSEPAPPMDAGGRRDLHGIPSDSLHAFPIGTALERRQGADAEDAEVYQWP